MVMTFREINFSFPTQNPGAKEQLDSSRAATRLGA